MVKHIKEITTSDTKQTYRWVDKVAEGVIPQLIEVEFTYKYVNPDGTTRSGKGLEHLEIIYVERSTLVPSGVAKELTAKGTYNKDFVPTETVEELLLRLLGMIGVNVE